MNSRDEVTFRLGLADGFLREAEQDLQLERWRSCVDNSQLAAKNAGKSVLALFGVPPKTHEPARELAALVRSLDLPATLQEMINGMLPDLLSLGLAEHFMTDYGDEATYTLPWELFSRDSAVQAFDKARRTLTAAREVVTKAKDLSRAQGPANFS